MLARTVVTHASKTNRPVRTAGGSGLARPGDRLERPATVYAVRVVIARCQVDYGGRLTAHLPMAKRLIIIKSDGSVAVHSDDRAYKPLNWMSPPCTLTVLDAPQDLAATTADLDAEIDQVWMVKARSGDILQIAIAEIIDDHEYDLGIDPGLQKDGVEAHLQALLAENPQTFGKGYRLVRREFPTAIGPVDLLLRSDDGGYVAVEVKRRGEIDGVEQLTRYLELMNADPLLAPVRGVFAAQLIKPQAKVLASTRHIDCVTVDYDALRGIDNAEERLF
ncbi:endonuclease NucS [Propionibacterium freudenreichii]|nr:endonuclease NucS [Propionibacterium freudenreichii]MDK9361140.1 endonuclease NucS [Propionibacterium freudenreichii]MDK9640423.1 endonuclease NucS [Propionibacterium freudenreichii]